MAIPRRRRCAAGPRSSTASLDNKLERITGHPLAYVGRLDGVLAELLDETLPRDDAAYRTDRILIGLRRWTWTPLPSLSPAVSQRFSDRRTLRAPHWPRPTPRPIASLRPAIRYAGAWCADGVNAFSLWCAVPYLCAVMRGAAVAAPRETVNGAQLLPWNHIYAAWNWPVLDRPVYDAGPPLLRDADRGRPRGPESPAARLAALGRDALSLRVPARGGARRGRLLQGAGATARLLDIYLLTICAYFERSDLANEDTSSLKILTSHRIRRGYRHAIAVHCRKQ